MAGAVIEVRGLTKHYADVRAVDGIDFEVRAGEIFSLLGPNGAGKTTTVEILEGLRDPTGGEARVFGVDVRTGYAKIRDRVGVLPQDFEPFDRLKPREAVAYWAALFDRTLSKKEVADVLERVGLTSRADAQSMTLSGGGKRQPSVAATLLSDPAPVVLRQAPHGPHPFGARRPWGPSRVLERARE